MVLRRFLPPPLSFALLQSLDVGEGTERRNCTAYGVGWMDRNIALEDEDWMDLVMCVQMWIGSASVCECESQRGLHFCYFACSLQVVLELLLLLLFSVFPLQ